MHGIALDSWVLFLQERKNAVMTFFLFFYHRQVLPFISAITLLEGACIRDHGDQWLCACLT